MNFRKIRSWLCKYLGWHKPNLLIPIKFDGYSHYTHCKYCDKSIIEDSQGNWFWRD